MKRRVDPDLSHPTKKRRVDKDDDNIDEDMNDIQQSLQNANIALCKFNCNRSIAPGLTRNNNPYDTCCRQCAVTKGRTTIHDNLCDVRNNNGNTKMILNGDINEIMTELGRLAKKSNLIFGSEGEDKLNPIIISKYDYQVLPVRQDIISAIQKCKCLISSIDGIIGVITDFIVSNEQDTRFTTKQFMLLVCKNHNLLSDFHTSEAVMRRWYLNDELINDIDGRRKCFTRENLLELSGLKGYQEDGWEDEVKWDFIEFMNNNLLNVSIITVPTDSFTLESSKYNTEKEDTYVEDPWNFIHDHFIVGRTKRGDVIGYKTRIIWT